MFRIFSSILLAIFISTTAYTQITYVDYSNFLDVLLGSDDMSEYKDITPAMGDILNSSSQIQNLFYDVISDMSYGDLMSLANNPFEILESTTNENVILLFGSVMAFTSTYQLQQEVNALVFDKLKTRMSFVAAGGGSGYGFIVPTSETFGSLSLGMRIDIPDDFYSNIGSIDFGSSDAYDGIANALVSAPLPYLYMNWSANFDNLPLTLGLQVGFVPGAEWIYGMFINDITMSSFGINMGSEFKYLFYERQSLFLENDKLLIDTRLSFNYDFGKYDLTFNRNIFVPVEIGFLGGTTTGVVYNGDLTGGFEWNTLVISPKVAVAYEMNNLAYVDSITLHGSLAVDFSFGHLSSTMGMNDITSYANIVGNSITITDVEIPNSTLSGNYNAYDIRLEAV